MRACLRKFARALTDHDVRTVQEVGWASLTNGALLQRAEQDFDVFLTADKNLKYQQNLKGPRIAIVELSTNKRRAVEARLDLIRDTVARLKPGDFVEFTL
jgi:hypothetical protein